MRTTLKDVAKAAGVSHTTVSRVLNGRANVSQTSRLRVEAAARALGYHVHIPAPGLACSRTSTLGLLIPISLNPFIAEMAQAIVREARRYGQAVVLDMFDVDKHDELDYLQLLREKRVDGALIGFDTFAPSVKESIQQLLSDGFPLVSMGAASASDLSLNRVAADDEAAGYAITRHLIELGHSRIAIMLDRLSCQFLLAHRVRGYQRALAEAGNDADPEIIIAGADSPEATRRLALSLLGRDCPTAIFGCNDYTAIVAQHALIEAGMRVPQDISIVGYDGIELGAYVTPALTTVAYPWSEVARYAIRLLLELIESRTKGDASNAPCRQVLFPYELIIRMSSGPPPTEHS
jgi:DNA-binding LacI/PurR family transcriptional regulator